MKKLALVFVWLLVVAGMFSAHMTQVDAQRGDLYGARAIQSLEQLLNADGVIGDFAPAGDVTIAAGSQLFLPDGSDALPALAFTTYPATGLWVDGGTERIHFSVAGVRRWTMDVALLAGTDGVAAVPVYSWFSDANSGIYRIGADNIGMSAGGALVMDWEDTNAAGAGADLVTISSTPGIMDGAPDFFRGLYIDIADAAHTGGNLYGIDVAGVTGTAAMEYAIYIGGGWDNAILVPAGSTAAPSYSFTNDPSMGMYRPAARVLAFSTNNEQLFTLRGQNTAGSGRDYVTLDPITNAMDGADTIQGIFVDIEVAAHTGVGNTVNLIATDAIAGDANSNLNAIDIGALTATVGAAAEVETAINVGAGWDYTLNQVGIAFADFPAASVGAMVYCTNCDLGSVPCASTPGPGAWAFGTSTGPRWECPW